MIYNILDSDPTLAAQAHCDQDVITNIFLITQDLSCIHWERNSYFRYRLLHSDKYSSDEQFLLTTQKYQWAALLLKELLHQYEIRYLRSHQYTNIINLLQKSPPRLSSRTTKFLLAVPNRYKTSDPVLSYRAYYQNTRKASRWKRGVEPPEWWHIDQLELINHFRYKNIEAELI